MAFMRYLFVSAQIPGHLDWGGYLPTAIQLQRRGHTVLWATGQAMAPLLTRAGIPGHFLAETGWRWPPPPPLQPSPGADPEVIRQQRALRALDQWLEEERVAQATTALVERGRTFRPDVVISEVFLSAGGLAAEVLGCPFIVAGWPAMPPKAGGNEAIVAAARQRLQRLCDRFGVTGVNWTKSGPPAQESPLRHITYWSPRWYEDVPLLPQTRHVGGVATPAPTTTPSWTDEQPAVFITLGTSFGQDANFFILAARAAEEMGCLPLLALGGQFKAEQETALRQQLPPTAIVEQRVDLNAVLPHVAAAIHAGGAGVTHALVTHAVPQIIVPHAADQIHQAQGVVRSGVGFHLPAQQATVDALVDGLAELLPDLSPLRVAAQELQDEFAQLGGVATAADLVEQVTR
ncbi:MAG: glycosyltransferase [Caldilinea sp. CFX5]|nr:glycosyltransferase [Caldilinea sp. CFX5]